MVEKSAKGERVILITGASSGVGAALAEVLASQHSGIKLVLASRDRTLLEAVATKCRQHNAEVLVIPTDLSQQEQVRIFSTTGDRTLWTDRCFSKQCRLWANGSDRINSPRSS